MIPIQHVTDGYKLDHVSQYVDGTNRVYNNFTPRSDKLANVIREHFDGKIVFFGLQLAIMEWHRRWQTQFFDQPKAKVIAAYSRRVKHYVGQDNGDNGIAMMAALHDLGYLPIRIKALPEGSHVPMRVPCFMMNNTHEDFAPLVNYSETYFSTMVWPMCNAASLSEQYWKASVRAAEKSGAPAFWAAIANHCFAGRGHRGDQDGMLSAMAHMIFSIGTDTLWAIDGIEEYYGGNVETECIGVSVNAFEHATASQRIAHFGSETESLRDAVVNLYPRGIFSYVGDTEDLFGLLDKSIRELKDIILGRQPDSSGLCKLVIRPDSSRKSPKEIILGYKVLPTQWQIKWEDVADGNGGTACMRATFPIRTLQDMKDDGLDAIKVDEAFYDLHFAHDCIWFEEKNSFDALEARGMLDILWEIFGGTVNEEGLRVLNDKVGIIYGEGITLEMQTDIYNEMIARGWCVSNVLFGVGSWAFLKDSSRDSYGAAIKATNSVVNGEELPMQKKPKTDSGLKHSAKGLLRVEEENGTFVLYENQTPGQYEQGAMRDVYFEGFMPNLQTFAEIRERAGFKI